MICFRVFLYDKTNINERKRLGDQMLIKNKKVKKSHVFKAEIKNWEFFIFFLCGPKEEIKMKKETLNWAQPTL